MYPGSLGSNKFFLMIVYMSESRCSLCSSPGTNKVTCPLNPSATSPNPERHPLSLHTLPPEIKQNILGYLDPKSLARVSRTSKTMYANAKELLDEHKALAFYDGAGALLTISELLEMSSNSLRKAQAYIDKGNTLTIELNLNKRGFKIGSDVTRDELNRITCSDNLYKCLTDYFKKPTVRRALAGKYTEGFYFETEEEQRRNILMDDQEADMDDYDIKTALKLLH